MLLFIPVQASDEIFLTGWWKLKITGPILNYSDIKHCYIKVSTDGTAMLFSSIHEDQYKLRAEYCGDSYKECKAKYAKKQEEE
jgi:hypothetical protein